MDLEIDFLSSEALEVSYKEKSSKKLHKIYWKTLVSESHFKKRN